MTTGWQKRPIEQRANAFEQCILEMIHYHSRRGDWNEMASRPTTDAEIREAIIVLGKPRVFKCAGHICRLEDHDGKPVLYYDAKPLGGDWLIERVRELLDIPTGQLSLY